MSVPLGASLKSLGKITVTVRTITGAADNGAGLVRITSAGHGFVTGDIVVITLVTGTTEANGRWTIIRIDANTFDLVGSVFANVYVAGGKASIVADLFANYTVLRTYGASGVGIPAERANSIFIQALLANTGTLYVGVQGMDRFTGAGVIAELDPGASTTMVLGNALNGMRPGEIRIDADTTGNGCYASYTPF